MVGPKPRAAMRAGLKTWPESLWSNGDSSYRDNTDIVLKIVPAAPFRDLYECGSRLRFVDTSTLSISTLCICACLRKGYVNLPDGGAIGIANRAYDRTSIKRMPSPRPRGTHGRAAAGVCGQCNWPTLNGM